MLNVDTSKLVETLVRGIKLAETPMGVGSKGDIMEAKGWKEMVDGLPDDYTKAFAANMLENYRNAVKSGQVVVENTTSTNIGTWDKYAMPMISIMSENLIAQKLFTVQPLDGPTGLIFFANFVTGKDKGNVPRGSKIWDALTGHADRYSDSGDRVTSEMVGTVSSDAVSGSLAYTPVIPGTLQLVADNVVYRDGGDGVIYNTSSVAKGTIDYGTGEISVSDVGLPADGTAVEVSYNYHQELNPESQQVDLELQSRPIRAETRKLRARWTREAAMALEALHKANAESMLAPAVTNHLHWEVDRQLIEDVRKQAGAGTFNWSANIPTNSYISFQEHKLSFIDALVGASSFIQRGTNRARANWALLGTEASNIVETLAGFEAKSDEAEIEGAHELGKLGRLDLFSDPRYPVAETLMGYKGKEFVRTGYVFAPWLLLFTTPTVELDDFMSRRGFASSYGKAMINNKYYATVRISNMPTSFGSF